MFDNYYIICYIFYIRIFLKVEYNMQTTTRIMTKLTVYVIVFTIIVCIVGGIMSYFIINLQNTSNDATANSSYSMLNLYFLKTVQTQNIAIESHGLVDNNDTSSYYITFRKEDGTTATFIKLGNIIYYNKIKLCENVDVFKVIVDKSEAQSFSVEVQMLDKVYNSQYALD